MDDSYSPWASNVDDDDNNHVNKATMSMQLPSSMLDSPDAIPSLSTPSWNNADDDSGAGWGSTSMDDVDVYPSSNTYSAPSSTPLPVSRSPPRAESPSSPSDKGWGSPVDEAIPTFQRPESPQAAGDAYESSNTPRPISPSPDLHSPLQDAHELLPGSTPPISSPRRESAVESVSERSEGGWAVYGSPELPPISSLRVIDDGDHAHDAGDGGWNGDAEWQPPDIPEPLPSFGDAFESGKTRSRRQSTVSGGEGWVDPETVSSWTPDPVAVNNEHDSMPQSRTTSQDRGWDPEAFEQGKTAQISEYDEYTARIEAKAREEASIEESRRDVEGPFQIPSSLLAELKDGIADAAALSGEALRGASSAAARLGEDIRATIEGETGAAEPRTSSEDTKPAARGWFGRGSAAAKPASPKSPGNQVQPRAESPRSRSESPDPAPSAVGRFFSRFKRPTNDPVTQAPSNPRTSDEQEQQRQAQPAWQPRDLDALENPGSHRQHEASSSGRSSTRGHQMNGDGLDDFFGDSRAMSGKLPTGEPEDDFGGLLGAFSQPPKKTVKAPRKSNTSLDPFDPFANDDDDDVLNLGMPPPPTRSSLRPTMVNQTRSLDAPGVKTFKTRALTPEMPVRASSSLASFPSTLAAPQARAVSNVHSGHSPAASSPVDDDFDAFFNSATPAPKPLSAPPLATRNQAQSASTINVAPVRATTISPPPPSHSPISPLAPPPPPSQPVQRGAFGFGKGPPPAAGPPVPIPVSSSSHSTRPVMSTAPLAPAPRSTSTPISTAAAAVKPAPSGPLSKDDFAFFEM